jgi:hypothetical protein
MNVIEMVFDNKSWNLLCVVGSLPAETSFEFYFVEKKSSQKRRSGLQRVGNEIVKYSSLDMNK